MDLSVLVTDHKTRVSRMMNVEDGYTDAIHTPTPADKCFNPNPKAKPNPNQCPSVVQYVACR